jgi:hypothetical protein
VRDNCQHDRVRAKPVRATKLADTLSLQKVEIGPVRRPLRVLTTNIQEAKGVTAPGRAQT